MQTLASTIHEHREDLIELAMTNGGNTRSDAKFDIDGATGTLAFYAKLGEKLGDKKHLPDGDEIRLTKNPRWVGRHVYKPMHGVAILINAFNFPAWGFAEKAATAILAGMPIINKPATSTSLVAARITEILVEQRLANFSPMLASFGFNIHLITLPEFHITAFHMHNLAKRFTKTGIEAFVSATQRPERIKHENDDTYTYYKHQTATGTGIEAAFNADVGSSNTNVLTDSTESEDIKKRNAT